ncbi:hypothetical protein KA977_05770 [Candidatus Dependentiae bacterium]|nr:hypothetical protein [Candidatus Dependentiae bacterium]
MLNNLKVIILTIVITLCISCKVSASQNLYVSLFLTKDYEIKSMIFDSEPKQELDAYLIKIKNDIIQNISNDAKKKYELISDFEIFRNLCLTNFKDKKKLSEQYMDFKNKIIINLTYLFGDTKGLRLFIKNGFNNLQKYNFKTNYILYNYELNELKNYNGRLAKKIEENKIGGKEPRLKFLSNYLLYLNEKIYTAYLDKDLKSFKIILSEYQTVFEYIDNRLSLKNL